MRSSTSYRYALPLISLAVVGLLSIFSSTFMLSGYLHSFHDIQIGSRVIPDTLGDSQYHYYLRLATEQGTLNVPSTEEEEMVVKKDELLNVIVLYPDDWRYDDIGGLAPIVRTPFLNRLARKGIHFTYNAVTTSICWISRATLFTGQYLSRHASPYLFRPNFARNWNQTWPYMLQQRGYYVGHVGKWQYRDEGSYDLDEMFNFTRMHESYHWYENNINGSRVNEPAAEYTKGKALEFLRSRPKNRPFALTVAFYPPKAVGSEMEPGAQWMPTNETKKIYENETIPFPYNMTEAFNSMPKFFREMKSTPRDRWVQRWRTDEHYQTGMKNYYALITHVDQACEQIFLQLEKDNLLQKTMIIFTTDNGLFHGAHGLAGKWFPYQESIRVPLIIYDPRMPKGKRGTKDDSLTLNVDLAETILGAAGIEPHPLMQGRDIADLYLRPPSEQKSPPWRNEFYYEYPIQTAPDKLPATTALVRKDWKYIHWPQYDYDQLFDLTNDPFELNDLATDLTKENEKRIQEMKARHEELRYKVMEPIIPGSPCDPFWPPGMELNVDELPFCYPPTFQEEMKKKARRLVKKITYAVMNGVCAQNWQYMYICNHVVIILKLLVRILERF